MQSCEFREEKKLIGIVTFQRMVYHFLAMIDTVGGLRIDGLVELYLMSDFIKTFHKFTLHINQRKIIRITLPVVCTVENKIFIKI